MDWLSAQTPLVIGHRGAAAHISENTLASFALAVEQGAAGVEFDVRLSADGSVVVIHDATVDRTTNGTGAVSALTLAELQVLDAGDEQTIPTLDQVFETFGPSILYNIEIKDMGWRDRALEYNVAERIRAYGLESRVVVSSFNPWAVRRARNYLSRRTMVAMVRQPGLQQLVTYLAQTDADHPHHSMVQASYMKWAGRRGYRVHVWTVDDEEEAVRMARLGVHAIITNSPERILACLA